MLGSGDHPEGHKHPPHHDDGGLRPHEIVDQKVETIQERNARVEANKAWEVSLTRRVVIALGTYVVIGAYLTWLAVPSAWLHALVPPVAYVLSTLSLPFAQKIWKAKIYRRKGRN